MDNSRLSLTDNYATKDPVSLIDGENEKMHPRILFHVFMGLRLVLSGVFFSVQATRCDVTVRFFSGSCKFHIRRGKEGSTATDR